MNELPSLSKRKIYFPKLTKTNESIFYVLSIVTGIIEFLTTLIAGISQLVGMEIQDDVCITRPPELNIEIKFLLYAITITVTMIIGCSALFVFYQRRHRSDYQGMYA